MDTRTSTAAAPRLTPLAPAAIGLLALLALTVPFLGLVMIPAVGLVAAARVLASTGPRSAS